MNYKIEPTRLRELRTNPANGRKLSQEALAKLAKIAKRQIQRIERSNGPVSVRQLTLTRLAAALKVEIETLSGEAEMPTETSRPNISSKTSVNIDSNVLLNFDLLEKTYGASFENVINIAPALFAIHAELSLRWRTKRFKKRVKDFFKMHTLMETFPELQQVIGNPSEEISEYLMGEETEEEVSIKHQDVYGDELDFYEEPYGKDYENPFAEYLRVYIEEKNLGETALLRTWGSGLPVGLSNYLPDGKTPINEVCKKTLSEIAANNPEAISALRAGATRIKSIPIELLANNKSIERGLWIANQAQASKEIKDSDNSEEI
jgi:transcriptional regulator with XRE-family HTH domain